jgi:hypothetical protein
MTLDADVLLCKAAVSSLAAEAEKLPQNYFQIEGQVFDKLLGVYRNVGHRIYRTSLLEMAIARIPTAGTEVRPEDATVRRMGAIGFPSRHVCTVVGIHDFEQFYRDIYRKAFVHANKHQYSLPNMVTCWKRLGKKDGDYRIALRGLYDGLMSLDVTKIDTDAYPQDLHLILEEFGLSEKNSNISALLESELAERVLNQTGPAPVFEGLDYAATKQCGRRLRNTYKQLGLARTIPFLIGKVFSRMGNVFNRIALGGFRVER